MTLTAAKINSMTVLLHKSQQNILKVLIEMLTELFVLFTIHF